MYRKLLDRKLLAVLIVLILLIAAIPSMAAADQPVVYKSTITLTEDGGRYQVGFVNLEFKKESLEPSMLPLTFDVEISAVDGIAGIEVTVNGTAAPVFFKQVHIRVDSYKGLLFDKSAGKNIEVDIKKQQIKANHFSRYAFS